MKLIWLKILLFVTSLYCLAPARADNVRYLARGDQALAAIVTAIESAQESIDLVYFIFEPCHPSSRFVYNLLLKKAQSGIKVRFLLDAFLYKQEIRNQFALELQRAGAEFKVFNPRFKIHPANNFRLHVKLLLVDGKSYITGGRNIADEYFGLSPFNNFVDRDIWVTGASAKQAQASFTELWNTRLSRPVPVKSQEFSSWNEICQKHLDYKEDLRWNNSVQKFIAKTSRGTAAAIKTHQCQQVRFISDNPRFASYPKAAQTNQPKENQAPLLLSGERLKQKRVTAEFLKFITETEERLEMENWSYLPLEGITQSLEFLRSKLIPILVITNLDADTAGPIKRAEDFLNHHFAKKHTKGSQVVIQIAARGNLSDRHRLTPKNSSFRLHQKTALRDGRDVIVGSFNIDPRSYHTNLESMVVVDNCISLAQELTDYASDLVKTYNQDSREGYNVSPPPPGLGTLIFSFFGFHLL